MTLNAEESKRQLWATFSEMIFIPGLLKIFTKRNCAETAIFRVGILIRVLSLFRVSLSHISELSVL